MSTTGIKRLDVPSRSACENRCNTVWNCPTRSTEGLVTCCLNFASLSRRSLSLCRATRLSVALPEQWLQSHLEAGLSWPSWPKASHARPTAVFVTGCFGSGCAPHADPKHPVTNSGVLGSAYVPTLRRRLAWDQRMHPATHFS